MPPTDEPLTRERILVAAEDVIRRFGPAKATVVDVARALGVSHAAVYRHIATKAELRDLVVGRCAEVMMPRIREIAASSSPAPQRLRALFDALVSAKRSWSADDPELFTAYRTLAPESRAAASEHIDELLALAASIIQTGVDAGSFRTVDAATTARAVFAATMRFHHPVFAAEWTEPTIDAEYNGVWELAMNGLLPAR